MYYIYISPGRVGEKKKKCESHHTTTRRCHFIVECYSCTHLLVALLVHCTGTSEGCVRTTRIFQNIDGEAHETPEFEKIHTGYKIYLDHFRRVVR